MTKIRIRKKQKKLTPEEEFKALIDKIETNLTLYESSQVDMFAFDYRFGEDFEKLTFNEI